MSIGFGKHIVTIGANSKSLSTSYERLSSGQRINRASDDPAGLAIADSLNSKSRVYSQGIRNLHDGTSLIQVADAAIGELSNITSRLVELAQQAANGVLTSNQRDSLDTEAQALKEEYSRVIESTKFNGVQILSADLGELRIQDGYGADGGIQSSLGGVIGTGTFSSASTLTAGTTPKTVVSADFNNDGVLDFANTNFTDDNVTVFIGNGDGSFSSGVAHSADNGAFGLDTADFNQDGK